MRRRHVRDAELSQRPTTGEFWKLLYEIRRHWKTTNMGLERLLKETKCAFPSFYGPAYAETTAIMAAVSQLWKNRDAASNGENPFTQSREEMEAAGLPVQAFTRSPWHES